MDVLLTPSGGKEHLLLGNEAIVRGALEAGMAFATCYPGTPSSEVPDTLYRLRKQFPKKVKYYFEYSTNEKVALECAAGAAASGVRTLCTMKHVGVNVAADPLMTLAYVGVNAGMVILTADDPSLFSSQNEQDNRYYARLSGLPMLEPTGPAEAKEMTAHCFDLSEELGSPVMIRTTTRVNHAREAVPFAKLGKVKQTSKFVKNPMRYVTVPAVSRNLHLRLLNIYKQAQAISEKSPYNQIVGKGKLGVITSGVAANYVLDAVADLGAKSKIKVLKLGFTYPLPEKKIARFLGSVDKVLIVEELEPILEEAVRALAQDKGISVEIAGKAPGKIPAKSVDIEAPGFFSRAFEYNPRLVREVMAKYFGLKFDEPAELKLAGMPTPPGRPPNLCPGCPHRATYFAVKEVAGDETIYPTDIGCYTLGVLPPIKAADFLICMGSSVSSSGGISRATGQKVVSFIGDSTFFHSGITGLVNAVHNNHNFTLVVLDNGTTAMTGHQPHPGVNTESIGDITTHIPLEPLIKGLGVEHVVTIKPFKVRAAKKAIEEAIAFEGVSVVISQELCPLFARRVAPPTKRVFQVVEEKCKGHLDCIKKVACPAMFVENGQARINPLQCIGCALCAQICPENAILPVKAKG
ncbi:MAG: indolepyruvate ferredoxin oxidoreductase subunit alpha [Desulfarculaceae bacterium]|nr:indolepyruvate ferredoxin oxidoreductase subunit alpha [Desulfarculaceae bacterium]MCF8047957.1 indolepyruvate ferredoxin oxidoreductase subunit alpha [Desulfarculaceae bacterium]MCF8099264.1 indolepyruvate ferredoxin oxidoreductase subunit alpha [Desulfarculaceae bacterium]